MLTVRKWGRGDARYALLFERLIKAKSRAHPYRSLEIEVRREKSESVVTNVVGELTVRFDDSRKIEKVTSLSEGLVLI